MNEEIGGGVEKKIGVEIFRGALIERLDEAFNKVAENVSDINTDAEAVREIVIRIRVKPMSDRRHWQMKMRVVEKLAPYPDVEGMVTAKYRDGKAVLYEESGNQIPMEYETKPVLEVNVQKEKK